MDTCDYCRQLLWDDLFGLLEAGASESVRNHVAVCSACQAELATAVAEHRLVAEAARLDVEVPHLTAPVAEELPPVLRAVASVADVNKRRVRMRPWLATAAAVLLVIGLPYGLYQAGRIRYQSALRAAEGQVEQLVGQREEVRQQARRKEENLVRVSRTAHSRLQVVGPAAYQPGTANYYRVWVTDVDGHPAEVPVTARLLHAGNAVVLQTKKSGDKGEWLAELPADLRLPPDDTVRLELVAQGQEEPAPVHARLRVLESAHVTHLATDKPVYHPGETIYFRSVTLERFGRKTPERDFTATYTLTDAAGDPFQSVRGLTHKGGIGGGDFQLSRNWPAGEYTLTVTEADNRFPPVSRRFLVRPEVLSRLRKTLRFDRASYKPGDRLQAHFQAERLNGSGVVADLPVAVTVEVDGRPVGAPQKFHTDAKGSVSVDCPLPAEVASGTARLAVVVTDRGEPETLTRTIPVAPDRLEVEFFPEGGDLVVGCDNRVYFRVRTPLGQPADLQGTVVDSRDREVVAVHTTTADIQPALNRGLGVFTLRPEAGETYRLRIISPQGRSVSPALPAAQAGGVALSLPEGVTRQDEAVRALLHQTGPEQQLVVAVFCQGRLVADEIVPAKPGTTEVRLTPITPCSGVLRVTVFEQRQGQLRPVAERLAYRRPQERLVLSVKADKESHVPAGPVTLKIRSTNEGGKPEPAWLLVSIVDQEAFARLTNAAVPNLPAYFQLTSELERPQDLEQADFLLSDAPQAAAALDLFLGTQGWRRFAEQDADLVKQDVASPRRAQDMATPAILKLDNGEQVEQRFQATMIQTLTELRDAIAGRDRELVREGSERLQAARTAAQDLDAYETRAGEFMRLGVGMGAVVLFVAGCLLLARFLLHLIRGLAANRAYLSGAFAALLLCALTVWGPASRWGTADKPTELATIDRYARALEHRLDLPALALRKNEEPAPSLAVSKGRGSLARDGAAKQAAAIGLTNEAGTADQRPKVMSIAVKGGAPNPPAPDPPRKDKDTAVPLLPVRKYAYHSPTGPAISGDPPDTILWHPILFAADGTAEVRFELPPNAATYRIRVEGHSAHGRLGAVEETIESRQNPTGAAK